MRPLLAVSILAGLAGCAADNQLVRFGDEAPGANCPSGGVIIYMGVDDNDDGVLDDTEVDEWTYVCDGNGDGEDGLDGLDGEDGQDGQDGEDGGGIDVGKVLDGSYTIHNSIDIALIAGVETITGDLTIDAPGMTIVELPDLVEVGGQVVAGPGNTTLETLALPALTTTGRVFLSGLESLIELDLSSLETVFALDLESLPISNLDAFATVTSLDYVKLVDLADLEDLSGLPVTSLIELQLQGSFYFTDLSTLAVTSVSNLIITDSSTIEVIDLPSLEVYDQLTINYNPYLYWLSLPALVDSWAGTYFEVYNNDILPNCYAQDLLDLIFVDGYSDVNGGLYCEVIDWCRLQFPEDLTADELDPIDVYGRLYIAGLTDQSEFVDYGDLVYGAVGVGDVDTDPETDASWTWTFGDGNSSWDGIDEGEPDNDEYVATFDAPASGDYDFAFRFTGDGGRTWTYCDRDAGAGADGSEDGYASVDAGHLTVN